MRRSAWCWRVAVASLGWAAARAAAPVPADWPALREATFTEVWRTVADSYFDPTFGGVDWNAVGTRYHAKLDRVENRAELRTFLQAMLNELHRTHFAILPEEAAVYRPRERTRIGTTGLDLAWIDRRVVVTRVTPASSAAAAGVKPGDAIDRIGGREVTALEAALERAGMSETRLGGYLCDYAASWLCPPVGTEVALDVSRPGGSGRGVMLASRDYAGAWSEPLGTFPSLPVAIETRRGADGVAYLRFNLFTPQLMPAIRKFLRGLSDDGDDQTAPAAGLVIDLRGNPGGLSLVASGIAGWLCQQPTSLGSMHLRQGLLNFDVFPQEGAFAGPLAILIDGRSASTSELLAVGLQEAGRARVFGEPSAGAALPSAFKTLPTRDLLQYAIADLQTPHGRLLEGRGVDPDVRVVRTRADVAAGRDPVFDAAAEWIHRQAAPADGSAGGP